MSTRPTTALAAAIATAVALGTLPGCELLVRLDRSVVEGGVASGCAICTDITEGGEDSGEDEANPRDGGDASAEDGDDDDAVAEAAPTDSGGDATASDGGSESSTTDSGAGE